MDETIGRHEDTNRTQRMVRLGHDRKHTITPIRRSRVHRWLVWLQFEIDFLTIIVIIIIVIMVGGDW